MLIKLKGKSNTEWNRLENTQSSPIMHYKL